MMYSFFVAIIAIFSISMLVIAYAELKENHPKILHWIMNIAAFVGIWFLVHSYIEVREKKAKEAPHGFGDTKLDAIADLIKEITKEKSDG